MSNKQPPVIYTLDEVADILSVTCRQIRRWRSLGLLQVINLGGSSRQPRVTQQALADFLRVRCAPGSTPNKKKQR